MAKHESLPTSADILARMRDRFTYLYTNDRYNGQYADEFCVLESILGDVFIEGEDIIEGSQFSGNFATSDTGVNGGECVGCGGGSRRRAVPLITICIKVAAISFEMSLRFMILTNYKKKYWSCLCVIPI